MTPVTPSRPRRLRPTVAAAVCVAHITGFFQPALLASERRLGGSVLEMRQRSSKFVDPSSGSQAGITDRPVYMLRRGDTVSLVVVDQNPLLFSYDVEVTATETEQHKAAALFAKSLSEVLGAFRDTKGGGVADDGSLVVEGLNILAFRGWLDTLKSRVDELPSRIDQTLGSEVDAASAKAFVASWKLTALIANVNKGYQQVLTIAGKCLAGQKLSAAGGIPIGCDHLVSRPAPRELAGAVPEPRDITAIVGGPSADASDQTSPPIDTQNPPRPATGTPIAAPASSSVSSPPGVAAPPATTVVPPPAVSGESIQGFITLALAMQSRVEATVALLRAFEADIAAVDTPKKLPPGKDKTNYEYSLNEQKVVVIVKGATKYDEFLSTAAKKRREDGVGRYEITLTPYTPALISVAPAFVILFGDNPTYKATKKGDAYEIEESNPDGVGYNLGAMLTITPRSWSEPTFGGQFQVGVSPTKNKIGFYAGAGIQVQQVFTIGAGVSWQQVTKLLSGNPGDTIASPDLLKTGTKYKPGFYIHITTNLK